MCTYIHVSGNMPTVSVRIPTDLKDEIDKHQEINWSEVVRQSMWRYLHKLRLADQIASKSELTEEDVVELSKKKKKKIAEHYR